MMILEQFDRSVAFDPNEVACVIAGRTKDESLSQFLGPKDLRNGTIADETLTEVREGKDYNSFGKTRRIEI